ncbi:MAG: hypothetical protein ACPGC4_08185, partial [Litorivicinaceae bacterium]
VNHPIVITVDYHHTVSRVYDYIRLWPHYHFVLFAQYAADIFPLAILDACLALNDLRLALSDAVLGFLPAPDTPC